MTTNKYPEVVAGAYVRNAKNEILLVQSYKWKDLWVVAGGHIEYGEKIATAVVRETKEELGIVVEFLRVIEVEEGIFPPEFHEEKHFIYIQCECLIKEGEVVRIDHREIQAYRWFTLDEALKQKLYPITRTTLEKLKANENCSQ